MIVWVVCTGSGYYADSVWSTREAALAELERLGERPALALFGMPAEDIRRYVQPWEVDKPEQHWAELNNLDEALKC